MSGVAVLACICLGASSALAQQKPQWLPGQMGLNAGIMPDPGVTYINMDVNYDAGTFNGPGGKAVPVSGTYNIWAIENIFYFVPGQKFLGANLGFAVMYPTAVNGNLNADLTRFPNLTATAGGEGITDLFVEPFSLGWHLRRADILVGDWIMYPTGRYLPGATNNLGTGYYGNHLTSGTTVYITKNKGTSANLFTDWEVHGARAGTNNTYKTPGQAFTDEWGAGQVLPLKKDMSQLLQLGIVGYDQWQVTPNTGTISVGGIILPASASPNFAAYSVHAFGGQMNYIIPAKHFTLFAKYYHEYTSYSHTLGTTIVFGGGWTWARPKA